MGARRAAKSRRFQIVLKTRTTANSQRRKPISSRTNPTLANKWTTWQIWITSSNRLRRECPTLPHPTTSSKKLKIRWELLVLTPRCTTSMSSSHIKTTDLCHPRWNFLLWIRSLWEPLMSRWHPRANWLWSDWTTNNNLRPPNDW